jgi:hypothetical protein
MSPVKGERPRTAGRWLRILGVHSRPPLTGWYDAAPVTTILAKAFCQVDTVRGYRYLDDAGSIMNRYADSFSDLTVGLNGLTMTRTTGNPDEIRVTPTQIWLGLDHPDESDVKSLLIEHALLIASMIGVTSAKRFGLRTHRLFPVEDRSDHLQYFAKFFPSAAYPAEAEPATFEATFRLSKPDANVRVVPVDRVEGVTADWMPPTALLVDVDAFRSGTEMPLSELDGFLTAAMESSPAISDRLLSYLTSADGE